MKKSPRLSLLAVGLLILGLLTGCGGSSLPTLVGELTLEVYPGAEFTSFDAIAVEGDRAYLVQNFYVPDDDPIYYYAFSVADISDRNNPTLMGFTGFNEGSVLSSSKLRNELVGGGDYYYFAEDNPYSVAKVLNVSSPQNPLILPLDLELPDNIHDLNFNIKEDTLYASSVAGLNAYDISDPLYPVLEAKLFEVDPSLYDSSDAQIYENFLHFGYGYWFSPNFWTTQVFDISDTDNPILSTPFDTRNLIFDYIPVGDYIYGYNYEYYVDESGEETTFPLNIYRVGENGVEVELLSTIETVGAYYNLAASENRLYVGNLNELYVFDTTNKSAPLLLGIVPLDGYPSAMTLDNNYLYIGLRGSNTLAIYRL